MSNKFEELETFFRVTNSDVICISEHWQSDASLPSFSFEGYSLANHFCRSSSNHGGVAIYVRNNLKYRAVCEIDRLAVEFDCEMAAIEIPQYHVIVVGIYHSPPPNGNYIQFLNTMYDVLNFNKRDLFTIIAGDFNVNFLTNSRECSSLVDLFSSFNLKCLINCPTRVCNNSQTCIDNIITDFPLSMCKVNSLPTGFSDHNAQTCCMRIVQGDYPSSYSYKWSRRFNTANHSVFENLIKCETWTSVHNANDFDEKFNNFHDILLHHFNSAFPLSKMRVSDKNRTKSWITPGIMVSSKRLKQLRTGKHSNINNPKYLEFLKTYKRIYYKTCRAAKKMHFDNMVASSTINRSKSIWNFIKTKYYNNGTKDYERITLFGQNDRVIDDPSDVANMFNHQFNDSALDTRESGKEMYHNHHESNRRPTVSSSSCFLYPINKEELLSVLKSFKNKNATGFDNLSCKFLLSYFEHIADPLIYLINHSFSLGIFPSRLKVSIVKPLHKKGPKTDINNYRPINNLSVFSKIFEKCFITRVLNYLQTNRILIQQQHGFVKNRSTSTALFHLINMLFKSIDEGDFTLTLYYDLTKAFESVHHDILLQKLEQMGLRGITSSWIRSFLIDRQQFVDVSYILHNTLMIARSHPLTMGRGVVQGSVIGPLLFLLYVNDLPDYLEGDRLVLYADDITMVSSEKTPQLQRCKAVQSNNEIHYWAKQNRLKVNTEKTSFMIFNFPHSRKLSSDDRVALSNELGYNEVTHSKVLGITVDSHLKWNNHIDSLAKRLSSFCYVIRNLRSSCGLPTLRMVYFSHIHSICTYGIILWGGSAESQRIFRTQKWAIRAMLGLPRRTPCANYFRDLQILTLPAIFIYECIKFVTNNPTFFLNEPIKNNDYTLRTRNTINIPRHRLSYFKKSPYYQCVSVFNRLPTNLRQMENGKSLLKALKESLTENAPYNINDFLLPSLN